MVLLTYLRRDVLWMIAFSFLLQGQSVGDKPNLDFEVPDARICSTRSINYINPGLPSQCHKRSWPGATEAISTQDADRLPSSLTESHRPTHTLKNGATAQPSTTTVSGQRGGAIAGTGEDIAPRTFISFEDWKDQRAREVNQDGLQDGSDQAPENIIGESSGEEGLALRVEAVSGEINNIVAATREPSPTHAADQDQHQDPVPYDEDKAQYYRSKDAGKTCKERFSYSSFDAGATVLKTNTGAKNPKAILVENKDSYMLLECAAKNKFVIVELTDDILIDTVVLANYEFFSSMVRQFRVSVSDRYPVKMDKWKILGTFEAKNSRDIQPFLVENPMIWAKYVRIEFLSHYGNEYYCPVSLLRVHGTRMLDSWKETESIAEDDDPEGIESVNEDQDSTTTLNEHRMSHRGHPNDVDVSSDALMNGTSANPQLLILLALRSNRVNQSCGVDVIETSSKFDSTPRIPVNEHDTPGTTSPPAATLSQGEYSIHDPATAPTSTLQTNPESPSPSAHSHSAASVTATTPSSQLREARSTAVSQPVADSSRAASSLPSVIKGASATPPLKSRNATSTSSSAASPTVQESFHKTVSKRLQLLETNVTLSLQYLEDQSRILQESQHLAERKQLAKVDSFLDNLNGTVLSELRNIRQQYDQIWQSTVIAIEGQKEQSQRELLALSSRLNLLADEVVFQKRMAIVQAVLLLSCLILVIFSRAASAQLPAIVHIPTTSSQSLRPHALELYRGLFEDRGTSSPPNVADIDVSGRASMQSVAEQQDGPATASRRAAGWAPSTPSFQRGHRDDLGKVSPDLISLTNVPGFAASRDNSEQAEELCKRTQADSTQIGESAGAQKTIHGLSPPASPDGADDSVKPRSTQATPGLSGPRAAFTGELLPRTGPKPLPALPEDDQDE